MVNLEKQFALGYHRSYWTYLLVLSGYCGLRSQWNYRLSLWEMLVFHTSLE